MLLRGSLCCLFCILGLLLLLLLLGSEVHTSKKEINCQKNPPNKTTRIGVVFDSGSQIGKQQMMAMKMALKRFHLSSCVKLELLLHDSHQNFTSPPSSAVDLITKGGVKGIVGESAGLLAKQRNEQLLLEKNDALLHNHCKPGRWESIENIEHPYVQEMGRFAVMEHTQKLVGASLKFICEVSGKTQFVSKGKKYCLVVKVEEQIITYPMMPSCVTHYMATVLEKPLDRSWKLLSFVPSN